MKPRAELIVADLDLARRLERAEGLANAAFVDARAAASQCLPAHARSQPGGNAALSERCWSTG